MTPSNKTPEVLDAIIQSIRNGAYVTHAAEAAGIPRRTFFLWRKADPEFADRCEQARAEYTNESIRVITRAGDDDWRARAWMLERTRGAEFREKKEVEVSGELALENILFDDAVDTVEDVEEVAGLLDA